MTRRRDFLSVRDETGIECGGLSWFKVNSRLIQARTPPSSTTFPSPHIFYDEKRPPSVRAIDARGARDARVPDEPARRAIDAPARREENIHRKE